MLPNVADINLPLLCLVTEISNRVNTIGKQRISVNNNVSHLENDGEERIKKARLSPEKGNEEEEKKGQLKKVVEEIVDDLGEWSDWIYDEQSNNDTFEDPKCYKFLPKKLRSLAILKQTQKLVKKLPEKSNNNSFVKWNKAEHKLQQTQSMRNQDSHVRPCKSSQKKIELTLNKAMLKNMTVINQFNCEFIAALATDENNKYLILIDQHAMDERIRYECLLREYMVNGNTLRSVPLFHAMEISDLSEDVVLASARNIDVFKRLGLTLRKKSNNSVEVSTIPTCLTAKKTSKTFNVTNSVKDLIMEIGEKLLSRIGTQSLPKVIHDAIASEACHSEIKILPIVFFIMYLKIIARFKVVVKLILGAIRFGDTLNKNQCKVLVSHWLETDLPNRCAHGRPVVIPLMEINSYTRKQQPARKVSKLFYYVY
uniref:MutL C-terminal dimerisation domain-containing protein n=1 Tax=Bracon brevicornis TaxID=1563983 RepID=A0A6V7ISZ6_9HYME